MLPKDLAAIIENCLRRGKRIYQGKILGAANTGGRVTVELDVPGAEVGRVVGAVAGNNCLGGRCTVLQANNGTWYALSSSVQQELVSKQITGHRRRRATSQPVEIYPFKVLFFINTGDLVVGGDVSSPTQTENAFPSFGCTNKTGKTKNDWIVGLRFTSDPFPVTRCHGLDHTWQLSSQESATTAYKTHGLWTSDLVRPVFEVSSTPFGGGTPQG